MTAPIVPVMTLALRAGTTAVVASGPAAPVAITVVAVCICGTVVVGLATRGDRGGPERSGEP